MAHPPALGAMVPAVKSTTGLSQPLSRTNCAASSSAEPRISPTMMMTSVPSSSGNSRGQSRGGGGQGRAALRRAPLTGRCAAGRAGALPPRKRKADPVTNTLFLTAQAPFKGLPGWRIPNVSPIVLFVGCP
jgi:hypothetical protein